MKCISKWFRQFDFKLQFYTKAVSSLETIASQFAVKICNFSVFGPTLLVQVWNFKFQGKGTNFVLRTPLFKLGKHNMLFQRRNFGLNLLVQVGNFKIQGMGRNVVLRTPLFKFMENYAKQMRLHFFLARLCLKVFESFFMMTMGFSSLLKVQCVMNSNISGQSRVYVMANRKMLRISSLIS